MTWEARGGPGFIYDDVDFPSFWSTLTCGPFMGDAAARPESIGVLFGVSFRVAPRSTGAQRLWPASAPSFPGRVPE